MRTPARYSFTKLFSPRSLFNSQPVNPTFDPYVLPRSVVQSPWEWLPVVAGGSLSTTAYLATALDGPMELPTGNLGIVTIPHWPSGAAGAPGDDGHASIIDVATGWIHSFWQLYCYDGVWAAAFYGASRIDGSGWDGEGARATGVACIAGVIRTHELDDGDSQYRHALAVSLPYEAMAAYPAFVAPAHRADWDAWKNTGKVPEGSLLMLPPDFDLSQISSPTLRKVCLTLMTYGGYVVDKNYATPFVIYVEGNAWPYCPGNELHAIREALRMVATSDHWIDGNGREFSPLDTSIPRIGTE